VSDDFSSLLALAIDPDFSREVTGDRIVRPATCAGIEGIEGWNPGCYKTLPAQWQDAFRRFAEHHKAFLNGASSS
jgi:hypothetical protein